MVFTPAGNGKLPTKLAVDGEETHNTPTMAVNLKSRLTLMRRIPMPLLSIFIGLFCGLFVWLVLDLVQPQALRSIFAEELKVRLEQQARETLVRFSNTVAAHSSTTRLLANHRHLANYLRPLDWRADDVGPPRFYRKTPPWLPDASLWLSLVQPSHILLLDLQGHSREIYQVGDLPMPKEFSGANEPLSSEHRVLSSLTIFDRKPFLLISEVAEDAAGRIMGSLLLLVPLNEQFLISSQQGVTQSDVVVGLLEADDKHFLASSDEKRLPSGTRFDKAKLEYQIIAQSFFEYEGSAVNMQFATLVPDSIVEATRERVAEFDLQQRLVAAIAFVSVFTLVFFLLSERLNQILRRISVFSQRALGKRQPELKKGNQLFVLEDWIHQFIQGVRETRDEVRLQHESEIQESEALKRTLLETALDSIVTVDQGGEVIEFNNTAEQIFGYKRENVIGRDFSALMLDPESRPSFRRMLGRYLHQMEDLLGEERWEMTAVSFEGVAFPVEVAIKPIRLQTRVVFTVYMHDISNRRKAEQEIRSLAKFPEESPSPVLRVNRPGVIIYANPSSDPLLHYWGCERAQTLPLYWRNRVTEVLDSGSNWESQVSFDRRTYSLQLSPVVDLDYVNIYGRDISAERQAEQQAREHQQELVHVCRLSTMGEMATGLAHELNQPLSAIANYANGCVRRLQLSGQGSDDILHALAQVNTQADRAGEIIRRLRALIGKQAPVRTVADIGDVAREVCSFVEFEARKANVFIEQELGLNYLPVRLDVVQIEQVLLNLLRNALDALMEIPEDKRRLLIRAYCKNDDRVCVEVVDSGTGIDEEARGRLFEPFFTTKESGMGMGLVISKTIIEDHNGAITVECPEEGGTCFSVILPSYRDDDEQ
ncbi:MAG: PAS domain S-box protein [Candidatus Sedimenticola sp. (ex Thyasira tokunagai)]